MIRKIIFIYGGPSDEHDISIKSFENIFQVASNIKHIEVDKIYLDKNTKHFSTTPGGRHLYWPIIHGAYGEDGQIQKILEKKKLKFIGNSTKSSKLSFDKIKSQNLLSKKKICTPKTILVKKSTNSNLNKISKLTFPVFLKPNKNGSSVGLLKLDSSLNLKKVLEKHIDRYGDILVQEFVSGREFTCGVLRKGKKFLPLIPTEIVLDKKEIFDYKNKYLSKNDVEITPPKNLDKKIFKKIQELALKSHQALGLRDYSRTDMILNEYGDLVVLEVNSVPGMTKQSIFPKQLASLQIDLSKFVNTMLNNYA